jgi:hypothetical protein
MYQGRDRRGGFTLVETLIAALLGLSAVALLGGMNPLADSAGVALQRRAAVRAAENLRAAWPGGQAPVDRCVRPEGWLSLAPDDARLWWADAKGWGAWAEASAAPPSVAAPQIVYEIALVAAGPREGWDTPRDAPAWIVVSWPMREGRGAPVERSRRQQWSTPVWVDYR